MSQPDRRSVVEFAFDLFSAVAERTVGSDAAGAAPTLNPTHDVRIHVVLPNSKTGNASADMHALCNCIVAAIHSDVASVAGVRPTRQGLLIDVRLSGAALERTAAATRLHLPVEEAPTVMLAFDAARRHLFEKDVQGDVLFSPADRARLSDIALRGMKLCTGHACGASWSGRTIGELVQAKRARIFAAHASGAQSWFTSNWIAPRASQLVRDLWGGIHPPLDEIRSYAGEKTALYFTFVTTYTSGLRAPASLVLLTYAAAWLIARISGVPVADNTTAGCIAGLFILLWAGIMLRVWRRYEVTNAHRWGVHDMGEVEELSARGRPATSLASRTDSQQGDVLRTHLVPFMINTLPALLVVMAASVAYTLFCERLQHMLTLHIKMLTDTEASQTTRAMADATAKPVQPHAGAVDFLLSATMSGVWYLPSLLSAWLLMHMPSWMYPVIKLTPTLLVTAGLPLLDIVSKRLAARATAREAHLTEEDAASSIISKRVLFGTITALTPLVYVAFVQRDMGLLRERLVSLLVIKAITSHASQIVLPIARVVVTLFTSALKRSETVGLQSSAKLPPLVHSPSPPVGNQQIGNSSTASNDGLRQRRTSNVAAPTAHIVAPGHASGMRRQVSSWQDRVETLQDADLEVSTPPYDTFDDMLQMYMQYAQVVVFATAFPFGVVLALINNVLEAHTDGFKLLSHQRAIPQRVARLRAWQSAFLAISYLAVVSNALLIGVLTHGDPNSGAARALCATGAALLPSHWMFLLRGAAGQETSGEYLISHLSLLLGVFALEHVLIGCKAALESVIDEVPAAVRLRAIASARYRDALVDGSPCVDSMDSQSVGASEALPAQAGALKHLGTQVGAAGVELN